MRKPRLTPTRVLAEKETPRRVPVSSPTRSLGLLGSMAEKARAADAARATRAPLIGLRDFTIEDQIFARVQAGFEAIAIEHGLDHTMRIDLAKRLLAGLLSGGAPQAAPQLPERAPALWSERKGRKESPVAFIRRVYAPWIGHGLTRPHIKHLDPPLYNALNVWCHRNPDDSLPELLTASGRIDRMVEDLSGHCSPEDLRKLGLALQMRHRKQK